MPQLNAIILGIVFTSAITGSITKETLQRKRDTYNTLDFNGDFESARLLPNLKQSKVSKVAVFNKLLETNIINKDYQQVPRSNKFTYLSEKDRFYIPAATVKTTRESPLTYLKPSMKTVPPRSQSSTTSSTSTKTRYIYTSPPNTYLPVSKSTTYTYDYTPPPNTYLPHSTTGLRYLPPERNVTVTNTPMPPLSPLPTVIIFPSSSVRRSTHISTTSMKPPNTLPPFPSSTKVPGYIYKAPSLQFTHEERYIGDILRPPN